MEQQCLGERIENKAVLRGQVERWATGRNNCMKTIDWQFTAADARVKLRRLYPRIQAE